MLTYDALKNNVRKFVARTSLTPEEFEYVLPAFEKVYQQVFPDTQTKIGQTRERKSGGGRKGVRTSIEQKLLFALVYQKSYPVQSITGELFGMGQSQANEWRYTLLPMLKQALDDLGMNPSVIRKSSRKGSKVSNLAGRVVTETLNFHQSCEQSSFINIRQIIRGQERFALCTLPTSFQSYNIGNISLGNHYVHH